MSERGKRPGGARRVLLGAGGPSAVAVGAWRRTRSSRGSNAPPGRAGKPSTGRRGPVSTQPRFNGRRSPVNTGALLPVKGAGTSLTTLAARAVTPLGLLMESRMRGNSHVRFGGGRRGDHRPRGRHWRLAAYPAPASALLLSQGRARVSRELCSPCASDRVPDAKRQLMVVLTRVSVVEDDGVFRKIVALEEPGGPTSWMCSWRAGGA